MTYRWPVQECTHEHMRYRPEWVNWQGGVIRAAYEHCPDCGYRRPVE